MSFFKLKMYFNDLSKKSFDYIKRYYTIFIVIYNEI